MKRFISLFLFTFYLQLQALTLQTTIVESNETTCILSNRITLSDTELVYKDHILISSDHPSVTVSWKTEIDAAPLDVPHQKDHVMGFNQSFSILTTAITNVSPAPTTAHLHININPAKGAPISAQCPLSFSKKIKTIKEDVSLREKETSSLSSQKQAPSLKESFIDSLKTWTKKLEHSFTHTNSTLLKILIAFFLGLLLSLTPCIYPMIPITVGVLQAQGNKSMFSNFLLALMYTLGLATTFSLMGLIASTTGNAFGYLMANPIFIICIVILLCYFAFSMFGFYELYIPRFLQKKQSLSDDAKSSPYFSIFIFGLASGTFASPCLSPGLLLILTAVSTLSNLFLGFLLLFVFGIGISTPLLIIGTFSGSMNVLPRAGMWMIEIQKIFGFMLFGMCFYYLKAIVPPLILTGMLACFMLIISIYYFFTLSPTDSFLGRTLKSILGIMGIAAAVFFTFHIMHQRWQSTTTNQSAWFTDYDKAFAEATKTNKNIVVDVWAPYCSICKEITEKILKHPAIAKELEHYIILTVDAKDAQAEPFKTLKTRYDIKGVPDIFIINPKTNNILQRWHAELYEQPLDQTIKELQKYKKQ